MRTHIWFKVGLVSHFVEACIVCIVDWTWKILKDCKESILSEGDRDRVLICERLMRCVLDNTLSARAMLRFYNSVHQRSKAGGERDQPAVADKGSGARARRPIKVKYFFFKKKKLNGASVIDCICILNFALSCLLIECESRDHDDLIWFDLAANCSDVPDLLCHGH